MLSAPLKMKDKNKAFSHFFFRFFGDLRIKCVVTSKFEGYKIQKELYSRRFSPNFAGDGLLGSEILWLAYKIFDCNCKNALTFHRSLEKIVNMQIRMIPNMFFSDSDPQSQVA